MSAFRLPTRLVRAVTAVVRRLMLGRVPKLFDGAYYLRENRDVARSGIDPFLHYVLRGAGQGRNPAADFDTRFYRAQSGATRLDPVRHYLRRGAQAGLDPNPGFNTLWYASHYADIGTTGPNPLLHYRTDGRSEGRIVSRSAFGSPQPHMLDGVPAHHILTLPETLARFDVTLLRHLPQAECPDPARRICVFLRLTDAEIAGLEAAFAVFANGVLPRLTVAVDPKAVPHPQRPTLLATFEHAWSGEGRGTLSLRYAEARLWDLRPHEPRIAAAFSAGAVAVRRRI